MKPAHLWEVVMVWATLAGLSAAQAAVIKYFWRGLSFLALWAAIFAVSAVFFALR
jgi:hypothetical protein